MDQGKPSSSNSRNFPRKRSASTSNLIQNHVARDHADGSGLNDALLAQYTPAARNLDQAYSSTLSPGYYQSMAPLPGLYGNFLHHDDTPPSQSSSRAPVDFPWHIAATPRLSESSTNQNDVSQASSSRPGSLSFLDLSHISLHPSDATSSNPTRGQQAQVSAVASSSHEVVFTEAERGTASDEKRRRNTAASARFRVKKKHKTIALERTVSDLTGRAEELEREVGDLRRENGWLKEIVMLKGTQNISNNRLALRQAVALATDQGTSGIESTSQEGVSEGSSSELSDGEASVKQSKGHQKSRSTKP